MNITLSEKYDFCGVKDIYNNNYKIGDVLKSENIYTIRISKITNSNQRIYTQIETTNEEMIIQIIRNFLNQH